MYQCIYTFLALYFAIILIHAKHGLQLVLLKADLPRQFQKKIIIIKQDVIFFNVGNSNIKHFNSFLPLKVQNKLLLMSINFMCNTVP